jgi:hypothetical protein
VIDPLPFTVHDVEIGLGWNRDKTGAGFETETFPLQAHR